MNQGTTYVAFDDSKRKLVAAILRPEETAPEEREFPKTPDLLRRFLRRLSREGRPVRTCYEAGVRGTTSTGRSSRAGCPARSSPRR